MVYSTTYANGRQTTVTPRPELGTFGVLLRARRERQAREARADRESRLARLERDIKALEKWHHEWRLTHDENYRELHPGEWCEQHDGLSHECAMYHLYPGRRRRTGVDGDYELRTYSGAVIRSFRPSAGVESVLTDEERRTATRRMAECSRRSAR
ncbi:hypothetical protein [Streptomyces niveus]|uniref:hypothetical protein n=1 Tax=Streptomyces niveus TaxID=193462 RepID=UPI003646C54B